MDCQDITKSIKFIAQCRQDFDDFFMPSHPDLYSAWQIHQLIKDEIRHINTEYRITLSDSEIGFCQNVFDLLRLTDEKGKKLDVAKAYQEGEILLPTEIEMESAINQGYTNIILVPGFIDRFELFKKIRAYYQILSPQALSFTDGIRDHLDMLLRAILQKNAKHRPKKYYLFCIKPEDITKSHESTFGRHSKELEQEMREISNEWKVRLEGVNLIEYLLIDIYQNSLGQTSYSEPIQCKLLGETYTANFEDFQLTIYWQDQQHGYTIIDTPAENDAKSAGARYVILPKR